MSVVKKVKKRKMKKNEEKLSGPETANTPY